MKHVLRDLVALVALGASRRRPARTRQVSGYGGVLGEWELTANVTEKVSTRSRELHGAVTMNRMSACVRRTARKRKTGAIRIEMTDFASRLKATMLLDGAECRYTATLSDAYKGVMSCL